MALSDDMDRGTRKKWLLSLSPPGRCKHKWEESETETTEIGGGLEVRRTPKRCVLCGKRDVMTGLWMVDKLNGTAYHSLVPMQYFGCCPDDEDNRGVQ